MRIKTQGVLKKKDFPDYAQKGRHYVLPLLNYRINGLYAA